MRIHRLEVKILGLDFLSAYCPTLFTVGAFRQKLEKLVKLIDRKRLSFAYSDIRQIVVPNFFRRLAFGKKQQVCFDARAGGGKYTARHADDTPKITIIEKLALGLNKCRFRSFKQNTFIHND